MRESGRTQSEVDGARTSDIPASNNGIYVTKNRKGRRSCYFILIKQNNGK
jgi:hypothetical protein